MFLLLLAFATGCPSEEPATAPEPERSVAPAAAREEAEPEVEPEVEPEAEPEVEPDEGNDADRESGPESAEAHGAGAEPPEVPEADAAPIEVSSMDELVACMREAGVTIYGSVTCPFCTQLAQKFGGAGTVQPIYVECTQERQRCIDEMIGRGVPEIQIRGEMYRGLREPADIGLAAGCKLVQ